VFYVVIRRMAQQRPTDKTPAAGAIAAPAE